MSENALYLNGVPLYYTDRKCGRIQSVIAFEVIPNPETV